VFLSRGVAVDATVYEPEQRGRWLARLGPPYQQLAQLLGRQLDQVTPARLEAERWLRTESKAHPIIKKLSTAPGLGPIRTAQVVAIVGTPERFRTRQQFWSYCGLSIETRSSADWRPGRDGRMQRVQTRTTRGLTKRKQPLLKSVFKGAAKTVILQLPDDPLHAHYQRMLDKGIKPALARLTIARRIAATVLSMWRHQEAYDPAKALPHET
jgi:transposase